MAERPGLENNHGDGLATVRMSESSGQPDDGVVIRRILGGAVDDFGLLVQRHKDRVGGIVASRVRPGDVDGVAQQVFVRAFKSLASFSGKVPFENWLSRLAVCCCHDYWREKMREEARIVRHDGDISFLDWVEQVANADSEGALAGIAAKEESLLALEKAMGRLDADERWLLEAHYYEGMPLKEAAATLGWSLVKTKVKAMRARHKLRKSIDELIEGYAK